MRRTAFLILAVAGGLTALVLIAVAVVLATVDVHTLMAPVQARVKAATGRDLTIAGAIDMSLSLEPKIVVQDVTLGNAPWGKAPALLHARRVEARVALLPLLSKRFEVVELVLDDPVIALETDAQGRGNWEFGDAAPIPAGAPGAATASAVAAAGAFGLGNLAIANGTLTYADRVTGKTTQIAIERLTVRTRGGDSPMQTEFRGKVDDLSMALTGTLGPLDAFRAGRWPYPVAVKGDVAGKSASISGKYAVEGETTVIDDLDVALGGFAAKGRVTINTAGAHRRYTFALITPPLTLADLALPVAPVAATRTPVPGPTAKSPETRFIFGDKPIALDVLRTLDAEGTLAIPALKFDERLSLADVKLPVAIRNGRLDAKDFTARAFDGTLHGTLTIEALAANASAATLRLDGSGLSLASMLAAAGIERKLRGGQSTLSVSLTGHGASPHAWIASANGTASLVVGATTLVNTKLDLGNEFDKLAQAVNPFRERTPSTELECAVVRLPFADGIANIDRTIALETKEVSVSASGTLDFRTEMLDLAIRPRIRHGIPIDIPQFAELVRYAGPFTHPVVRIDAVASAAALAKIGAAIGTGGLSALGTSLISRTLDTENACDVALGKKPAAREPGQPQPSAADSNPANAIGKALGRLFGR